MSSRELAQSPGESRSLSQTGACGSLGLPAVAGRDTNVQPERSVGVGGGWVERIPSRPNPGEQTKPEMPRCQDRSWDQLFIQQKAFLFIQKSAIGFIPQILKGVGGKASHHSAHMLIHLLPWGWT